MTTIETLVPTLSEERAKEVLKNYGPGARVVAPYKPNRKQRRAQNKIRRSKGKK